MKPRELPWKWPLLGLGVLGLAAALLPRLIGDTAHLGGRAAAQLSAWTGGEVKLTAPIKISYFPDISVTAGLVLEGSKRFPMVQSIVAKEAKIVTRSRRLAARPDHHRCLEAHAANGHACRGELPGGGNG